MLSGFQIWQMDRKGKGLSKNRERMEKKEMSSKVYLWRNYPNYSDSFGPESSPTQLGIRIRGVKSWWPREPTNVTLWMWTMWTCLSKYPGGKGGLPFCSHFMLGLWQSLHTYAFSPQTARDESFVDFSMLPAMPQAASVCHAIADHHQDNANAHTNKCLSGVLSEALGGIATGHHEVFSFFSCLECCIEEAIEKHGGRWCHSKHFESKQTSLLGNSSALTMAIWPKTPITLSHSQSHPSLSVFTTSWCLLPFPPQTFPPIIESLGETKQVCSLQERGTFQNSKNPWLQRKLRPKKLTRVIQGMLKPPKTTRV